MRRKPIQPISHSAQQTWTPYSVQSLIRRHFLNFIPLLLTTLTFCISELGQPGAGECVFTIFPENINETREHRCSGDGRRRLNSAGLRGVKRNWPRRRPFCDEKGIVRVVSMRPRGRGKGRVPRITRRILMRFHGR